MKYSLIIPTLNEAKLLPELLNQLNEKQLRQSYDFEIIVSDGGSNDGTEQIALEHADKFIAHTKDTRQNISQGRNAGAEFAEGEWLIFMNGDVLVSDAKKFFPKLDKYSETDKYSGITLAVKVKPEEEILSDKIFLSFYNYYFHFLNLVGMGMGRGECMVISKKLFNDIGRFDEKLFAGEDFDLFTRVRRTGKIKFIHDPRIYESPRRFRKKGHFKILLTWLANSISVYINKKSISKEWEEVR